MPSAKPIIILVDDDESILFALKLVLQRDYDTRTTTDPVVAVDMVKTLNPSAVVLDVRMPAHDGFWVFARIREFDPTVPVIINSAYQDAMPNIEAAQSFKPFAYLSKGDNAKVFKQKVAEAVEWSLKNR